VARPLVTSIFTEPKLQQLLTATKMVSKWKEQVCKCDLYLGVGAQPSNSIMLHGDSDSCGNDDNDGGGVQNVSGGEDGDGR